VESLIGIEGPQLGSQAAVLLTPPRTPPIRWRGTSGRQRSYCKVSS
jgi:hypothetical protein